MKPEAPKVERVKIFTSGNSQAIRLPKKFRLPGQTAQIKRKGKSLVITPDADEDVWTRFDRGVEGLAGVWDDVVRNQPNAADSRGQMFP